MDKQNTSGNSSTSTAAKQRRSSPGSSSPVLIATPTSMEEEQPDEAVLMDAEESSKAGDADNTVVEETQKPTPPPEEAGDNNAKASLADTKQKSKTEKKDKKSESKLNKKSKRVEKKKKKEESSDAESNSSDSDDESSEDERAKKKQKAKAAARKAVEKRKAKLKAKDKAKRKSRKYESSDGSESSESDSDSDSESEDEKARRKKKAKAKAKRKSKKHVSSSEDSSSSSSSSSSSDSDSEEDRKKRKKARTKAKLAKQRSKRSKAVASDSSASSTDTEADSTADAAAATSAASKENAMDQAAKLGAAIAQMQAQATQSKQPELSALNKTLELQRAMADAATTAAAQPQPKKNALEFKRVDQVWDSKIRDYKYTESVEEVKDEFDCVFTVRRRFNWDNKYVETQVDIKSKVLRNVLQAIFKDCKGVSLVEDKPSIHPHLLFHYYSEIKTYVKKTLKPQLKKAKKRKEKKATQQQITQCKLLLTFVDEDYAETRKTLKPMLKAGTITYNLVWALFKPNTIAYTPTYGNKDDPRCFKIDYCYDTEDWFGNKKWNIEGRYLEYDGKVFGFGDHFVQIPAFRGPKKIVSLATSPIQFHKEHEKLQEDLIERGKKFVGLQGASYKMMDGLGYMKVKRTVAKININGRVMVDPGIFRRLNPNYPLSYIKQDELGQDESDPDSDSDDCCSGSESDSSNSSSPPKSRVVMWKDKSGKRHLIRLPTSEREDLTAQKLDVVSDESDDVKHVFTEEELLIASPVVLGFSFSEKMWLEFSLSGIKEIKWQDEAFESLVLPSQIKQNLKGLVSSHRFNAAKTIDDVIVGKGKGLNVVLHGPPGVGKTLTGESIAEFLRCPLYAVSSGELGTNASQLERDLNRIMEITHSWGAILLLDEADVFLEARQPHDIHRNALVSVFLRLTEYYQGILFLTTNRVATFDEAFQSRIHMGIRYENLTVKARKKIWMHYVGKVLAMEDGVAEGGKARAFADSDFEELSKKVLNGRQIKNAVKTSQSIAIAEKGVFSMGFVKRVMESHETFEEDMKGGRGYRDAMRHYT